MIFKPLSVPASAEKRNINVVALLARIKIEDAYSVFCGANGLYIIRCARVMPTKMPARARNGYIERDSRHARIVPQSKNAASFQFQVITPALIEDAGWFCRRAGLRIADFSLLVLH